MILTLPQVVNTLLAVALTSGLVMAGYRFGAERESPPWLAKAHGYAAVAALALLLFSWTQTPPSRAAVLGVVCLVSAAALGLVLNLVYHWRHQALPEGLVFMHMTIAFVGFLIVFLTLISSADQPVVRAAAAGVAHGNAPPRASARACADRPTPDQLDLLHALAVCGTKLGCIETEAPGVI